MKILYFEIHSVTFLSTAWITLLQQPKYGKNVPFIGFKAAANYHFYQKSYEDQFISQSCRKVFFNVYFIHIPNGNSKN